MKDFTELERLLPDLCMVQGVDRVPRGHLRIETGFLYPDGSSIDVFVVDDRDAPLLPPRKLSDLGQTMEFLFNHGLKPWTSKKRRTQLEDAVSLYQARLVGGALEYELSGLERADLQQGIVRLGQACLRVSDLLYTKRVQVPTAFSEDVEEFLSDTELPYEANATLEGPYAPVQLDFLVEGASARSAVLTLTSRYTGQAHTSANEVFRKFHDLKAAERPEQRVALLDDVASVVYREEDIRRIESYATVLAFSDRETVRAVLAA